MAGDDGVRAKTGIVVSLAEQHDGSLRLVVDDVDKVPSTEPPVWRTRSLFTFTDFEKTRLVNIQLSQKELAMIGENVLIRALALGGYVR